MPIGPIIGGALIQGASSLLGGLFGKPKNEYVVNGGVKLGHVAAQNCATLGLREGCAAASHPRFPCSWRVTGRLGPLGPSLVGLDQFLSPGLRARL
jgi:hypothetical protein